MEEFYDLNFIIKEAASKFKTLQKLGLSEKVARAIDDICKGSSIWILNKLIQHIISKVINTSDGVIETKEQAINHINSSFFEFRKKTEYIMEWIHIKLNGNNSDFKNLSFEELYLKSEEWRDTLLSEDGNINYVERNKIILDFRDQDGMGYYWTDLGTHDSEEEACRMGHCGASSFGNNLYSLRRVTRLNPEKKDSEKSSKSGEKYTLNKSVLTLEITSDGEIEQLKGAKNSKPKKEYHYFISELLKFKELDEKGVPRNKISGFIDLKEDDFHIEDLSKQDIIEVYNENPNIFKTIHDKCLACLAGAKGIEEKMYAEFEISEEMLKEMLEANFRPNYHISDIYNIIEDPTYFSDMFLDHTGISDVIDCIRYMTTENQQKAIEALKPDFPQIEEMELSNKIFNLKNIISLDENHFTKTGVYETIINSIITAREDIASKYFHKQLNDALSSFGAVSITEKDGIKIRTNLIQLIKSISKANISYALDIIKQLEKDYPSDDIKEFMPDFIRKCIEEDILEKEDFYVDFNNLPFDKKSFNEVLSSEL
jgi:hypothetical protein